MMVYCIPLAENGSMQGCIKATRYTITWPMLDRHTAPRRLTRLYSVSVQKPGYIVAVSTKYGQCCWLFWDYAITACGTHYNTKTIHEKYAWSVFRLALVSR